MRSEGKVELIDGNKKKRKNQAMALTFSRT